MLPKRFLILFFAFVIPLTTWSQLSGNISGQVYASRSGLPASDVEVFLSSINKGTLTDSLGFFNLTGIPPGKYELVFNHIGFLPTTKKIEVFPGKTLQIKVFLTPKTEQLHEVIIADTAQPSLKSPMVIESIHELEIKKSPARDIGEYLRSAPNLSGIRKGGSGIDPVLRGFRFKQLNVILNGSTKIEGGCPNRMDPALSHIDINDIKTIDVYKGPFALIYGPNFGGIISVQTTQAFTGKKFQTQVSALMGYESNWKGNKQRLSVNAGNRNIYFSLSGNQKKYGNYEAGNGKEMHASFHRQNYTFVLGASPVRGHHLVLSFDRSLGRNVDFPALPMDERSDDTEITSFDYTITQPGKQIKSIRCKLYNSHVRHIMDNKERPFSDTVVAISDIEARNRGGRLETQFSYKDHDYIVGVDYEYITKNGERIKHFMLQPNLPMKTEQLWSEAKIENTGVFVNWSKTIHTYQFTASARADFNKANSNPLVVKSMSEHVLYYYDNTGSNFINVSFSAGVLTHLHPNLSVGLSVGHGVRSPDMTERFILLLPVGYDNYDYLGNPHLKPEKNNEMDIKLRYHHHMLGTFNANAFFSYVQDYILGKEVAPSVVLPQTKDVYGVKEFENVNHVYLYGFECSYASPWFGNFNMSAFVASTFGINPLATQYIIKEGEVVDEKQVKNDPLPELPPLESNINLQYRLFNQRLVPRAQIRWVAPQNQISQAYYEQTTPGFAVLDLSFQFTFNQYLVIHSGVNNILNKAYYEHLNRRIIGTHQPYFEPGRVFFVNLNFNL